MNLTEEQQKIVDKFKQTHEDRSEMLDAGRERLAAKHGEATAEIVQGVAHFFLTMENIQLARDLTDEQCVKMLIGATKAFQLRHEHEHGDLDIETMQEWHAEASKAFEICAEEVLMAMEEDDDDE